MNFSSLVYYFIQDPTRIIAWCIYGVGIVLSIIYKNNSKRYSLVLISFGIFLIDSILESLATFWILQDSSTEMVQRTQYLETVNCVTTPFWVIAWALLFIALFKPDSKPNEAI
jgi:hypothetical protein